MKKRISHRTLPALLNLKAFNWGDSSECNERAMNVRSEQQGDHIPKNDSGGLDGNIYTGLHA
jgi:hypothetical protein